MASSLLLERFTHLPETVIAGFTDLQDLLKTKAKYDMNSFNELFKDPEKAWAENKAYWIKLGTRATTIVGVAVAGWACSFAENRDKPVDIQPAIKPQIGLITDSGGDSILESQLAIVQMQSGLNNNCRPVIIPADSGIPGLAETVGLCSIKEPEESTRIVMRKAKNGKTEVINVPLVAKSSNEIGYKKIGGEWVTIIKINGDESKWVFPDGREMTIKFDVRQAPEWGKMMGSIISPAINVIGVEPTAVPTSTKTSTPTATQKVEPTAQLTNTAVPTERPQSTTIPATPTKVESGLPADWPAWIRQHPEYGWVKIDDNGGGHWKTNLLPSDPCPNLEKQWKKTESVPYDPVKWPTITWWGEKRTMCIGGVNGPTLTTEFIYGSPK